MPEAPAARTVSKLRDASDLPLLFGALVVAACCGGPVLVAALLATGIGAILAALVWPALGLAVISFGAAAVIWWARHPRPRACDLRADRRVRSNGA